MIGFRSAGRLCFLSRLLRFRIGHVLGKLEELSGLLCFDRHLDGLLFEIGLLHFIAGACILEFLPHTLET